MTLFIPASFDFYMTSDGARDLSNVIIVRVLRVLRLMKVVRLVRATRVYRRWKSYLALSYGLETLVQCTLIVFLAGHWFACIITLQAVLHSAADQTWLGPDKYGICASGDDLLKQLTSANETSTTLISSAISSSVLLGCEKTSEGSMYLAALTWALMVLTGTGGTDAYPSAQSEGETFVVMVLVLLGALLWTYILSKFCDVAINSDPALTFYRQRLDDLNHFIKVNRVPLDMALRLREYVRRIIWGSRIRRAYQMLLWIIPERRRES
uniref:Ion transport domain-containing protein n=1 Tax=Haptolina brevifila TaxID=156173 RepID=A0A7S2H6D1_9EUKA